MPVSPSKLPTVSTAPATAESVGVPGNGESVASKIHCLGGLSAIASKYLIVGGGAA
jgi:hypothetical protein